MPLSDAALLTRQFGTPLAWYLGVLRKTRRVSRRDRRCRRRLRFRFDNLVPLVICPDPSFYRLGRAFR